ncbi:MAG TPA: arabinan endo-1,5-alpha-L-arabinosidase [Kofleriaceae bacterium]|jgi:arabinan endo-1,5-alpha-L-arabinosidase
MKYILLLALAACGDSPLQPDAAPPDDALAAHDSVAIDSAADPTTLSLEGAITPVHDPSVMSVDGIYMLFTTGTGLPVRTSLDLRTWSLSGQVFSAKPAWITTTDSAHPNDLWAPDISYFGGTYHLYYAASKFGSNTSCIGHATSLSPTSGAWTDHGAVVCSTSADTYNAIDPASFTDADGNQWLAFGSFWSGVKLVPLTESGARAGTDLYALSTRDDTAVEAPYLVYRDGWYYLFESVGLCCRGVDSTYEVRVGRAHDVRGPYVDADGIALLAGGGTLVVTGAGRWKGPGHNAVLRTSSGDYNVYHSYDADAGGTPTLRIAEMQWTADDWPRSAGP